MQYINLAIHALTPAVAPLLHGIFGKEWRYCKFYIWPPSLLSPSPITPTLFGYKIKK
jgi:hypothetical protein